MTITPQPGDVWLFGDEYTKDKNKVRQRVVEVADGRVGFNWGYGRYGEMTVDGFLILNKLIERDGKAVPRE